MSKSLVIVESPAKAKTIKKYLGADYEVMASVGHIIDLPKKSMGVDLESGNFTPFYEPISGKSKVISEIKKNAKKVDHVFLAPDPDREGEAIAFHIASIVKDASTAKHSPDIARIRFHELTKKAILEAFKKPERLNQDLFDAQQTRRILDRVVGYQISPILWKKVQKGLSAGRVQSVAVRLVVDREKEIEAFKQEEYWTIDCQALTNEKAKFNLGLAKINNKKASISNETDALKIKADLLKKQAQITSVVKKERLRKPGPPFITSKLQQDAARAFRFSTKQTMRIAQTLYEGVDLGEYGTTGLITYMRTDSTSVSAEAITDVRKYIEEKYGKNFLPSSPNYYKNKKNAQEAHEAIRPTSMQLSPAIIKPYLKPEEFKLYSLIYERFVASQMQAAVYDQTTLEAVKDIYLLRTTGSILKFEGFLKAYCEQKDEDDLLAKEEEKEENILLPNVKEGDIVLLEDVLPQQHFTQPPPRFTEASLVKELEEKGIGRPSTYATIMSTILEKGYTKKNSASRFEPTELGRIVTDLLIENFPEVMSVAFTASMEEKLDSIEEGKENWLKTMKEFYGPFKDSVDKASKTMRDIKRMEEKTDLKCPKCSSPLIVKWGKNGSFLGCSSYPDCSFTQPFNRVDGKIVPLENKTQLDVKCPSCNAPMLLKQGKFGEFLGCSRYPDCSTTMPIPTGVKCPKENCGGDVTTKRTGRGKVFYGCSNYPKCDFVSWQKPVSTPCKVCGSPYLLEKISKDSIKYLCPNCRDVTTQSE